MRPIPDPGFAADDGAADPRVREALAAAASGGASGQALAAVLESRVLVPVVAVLGELEHDAAGVAHEKSSDMAAVLMTGRDGRRALLAFTGSDSLAAWDPAARPVPMPLRRAAAAALVEGADAVVLDVAGPAVFAVEGADLRRAAQGARLVRVGTDYGWVVERGGEGSTGPV